MSVFDYNPEFMKEIMYEPRDEELGDIRAPGPVGSVGGFAGRMLRKNVADPLRGMYRSVKKAQAGEFKDQEEMVKAGMEFAGNLVGTPGGSGGFGSGWRSRTLETIAKNPKMPESASPQTWLSKLKGAGLPKDEISVAENFLGAADPKSKLSREQLHTSLNQGKAKETYEKAYEEWQGIKDFRAPGELAKAHKLEDVMERSLNASNLPSLGVTKTTLGGREWEAGQKRLDELSPILQDAHNNLNNLRGNTAVKQADSTIATYRNLLDEHSRLSQEVAGKRPKWPQYNIEGLKDYKEEYFHAPLKEGGTYRNADMEMHFADKPDNLLYLKHQGTLELPDGKKSTHMSTLQNDHAAEFEKTKKLQPISSELQNDVDNILTDPNISENDRQAWLSLVKDRTSGNVPEPIMLNTWWKHGLKSSIRDAVKAGHDYFTWDPADTQMKRFAGAGEDVAQYMKNHYDNNIPGFLRKEYGVEAKKVNVNIGSDAEKELSVRLPGTGRDIPLSEIRIERIPGGRFVGVESNGLWVTQAARSEAEVTEILQRRAANRNLKEVWQIPITEEIKKKVQEGQFWSKAARPGGKDAEGVA